MANITTEYRGIKITYNEDKENWGADVAGDAWEKQTLKECKKKIDDWFKKESNFQRFDVYYMGWGTTPKIATVTSLTDNNEAWITSESGRNKVTVKYLYSICDANTEIVKKFNDLENQLKQISNDQKELLKGLIPYQS